MPEFRSWLGRANNITKKKFKEVAFCKLCNTTIAAHRSDIRRHSKTDKHIRNSKAITNNKKVTDIVQSQKPDDLVRRAEIKLVALLATENLPFLLMDKLGEALPNIFPDSVIAKKISVHRTKATNILKNILGPHYLSNLKEILSEPERFYSIIVDETTDVSTTKQCAIVVVFCDNGLNIKTRFFQTIELKESDANSIYNCIIETFEKNNLSLNNLVGFSSDTTNVMFGEYHSLVTLLKNRFPYIACIKCSCHLIHLSTSQACLKLPRSTEDLLRNIGAYFSRSAKRQEALKEFQIFFQTDIHKILLPSTTRWLSLKSCIDRVLEQFQALKHYFISIAASDRSKTVDDMLNTMNNTFTRIYLEFMSYVLGLTNDFNLMFQKESPLLYKLKPEVKKLVNHLCSNYMNVKYVKSNDMLVADHRDPRHFVSLKKVYVGVEAQQSIFDVEAADSIKEDFFKSCLGFYVELVTQIKNRFTFNDELFNVLSIVDPKVAQSGEVTTLLPVVKRFPILNEYIASQELDNEWKDHSLLDFEELGLDKNLSVEKYWQKVFELKNCVGDLRFGNLKIVIQLLLVLPYSNASVERVFSSIKNIKTDHRNRLKTDTLNALLLTSEGVENIVTYEPSQNIIKTRVWP